MTIKNIVRDYLDRTVSHPLRAGLDRIFMGCILKDGELAGTIEQYQWMMGCGREETDLLIQMVKQNEWQDMFACQQEGDLITITCCPIVKMGIVSRKRKEAGSKGGNPLLRKNKTNGKKKTDWTKGIVYPFESEKFMQAWQLWVRYKREQFRFSYKPIGLQGALKELSELSGGNENTAVAIIYQSIKNGYMGLFKLKKENQIKQLTDDEINDIAKKTWGKPEPPEEPEPPNQPPEN
jgi:hypothetical protein